MTHWEQIIQQAVQQSLVTSLTRRADAAAEKWADEFMQQPGIKERIAQLAARFCEDTIGLLNTEPTGNGRKRKKVKR